MPNHTGALILAWRPRPCRSRWSTTPFTGFPFRRTLIDAGRPSAWPVTG
jgi:hypothetical protein